MSISTRRGRRRIETRQRLLSAASELFGDRGISATKVSDVCESADVALQTFFNHFRSKDDLVRELVAAGYDFVVTSIEEAHREGGTTGERIARLFSRILDGTTGAGPMHHELLVETFRISQSDTDPEGENRIQHAIGRLVRAGIANGEVTRRHAPEDVVRLVYGALNMLMFEWANAADYPIVEHADRMAHLLADAIAPAPDERLPRRRPHGGAGAKSAKARSA
jgi:AcrR family transcriptional regulator